MTKQKKTSIYLSIAEAEYIEAATCCTKVLWMKHTLHDMKINFNEHISIKCDNTSAIRISKNPMLHSNTKHIPIKYHFLREKVAEKTMKMECIPTREKIIDIFTKPLAKEPFEYLRNK